MQKLTGLICAAIFAVGCSQTDSGITTAVKSQLAADDTVSAYAIDVDTQDRVVTLTGEVPTPMARQRAVQIASSAEGVRDVVDQLVIDQTAATTGEVGARDVDPADIIKEGAEETGAAIKEGTEKLIDGAEQVGESLVDTVSGADAQQGQ